MNNSVKIALFASGNGTNAEAIIQKFKNSGTVEVALVLTNNPTAYVITRARNHEVAYRIFSKTALQNSDEILDFLQQKQIDFIVLAGFMWLVPDNILACFPGKIINIHPALLPKYGGNGMYGMHVHEAVLNNHEQISGITIHYVNEHYDEGDIIFQANCPVMASDTPESLASRIHELEHLHYPAVIEKVVFKQLKN